MAGPDVEAMMRAQAEWQARMLECATGVLECAIRQTEYAQLLAEGQQAELVALAEIKSLLLVQHPPEDGAAEGEAESVAELLAGIAEDVAEIGTSAGHLSEDVDK
jgi:ABC-type uncharacterized transport system ATPase subunit